MLLFYGIIVKGYMMVTGSQIKHGEELFLTQFSKDVFTLGMGHMLVPVIVFRALKTMHSLLPPSPLGTTTIGADQLEWLSLMTAPSSNLSISSLTQS